MLNSAKLIGSKFVVFFILSGILEESTTHSCCQSHNCNSRVANYPNHLLSLLACFTLYFPQNIVVLNVLWASYLDYVMYSFELCCKIFEFYETTLSENSAIVKDSKPMQKPIQKKKKKWPTQKTMKTINMFTRHTI